MMLFADFMFRAGVYKMENPHQRIGQSLFNYLGEVDSDLAAEICGTEVDCFYRDDLVNDFLQFVSARLTVEKVLNPFSDISFFVQDSYLGMKTIHVMYRWVEQG